MSVINTMLQELDKRNGRSGGEALAGDAIRSTKPSSAWPRRQRALLVLMGLATVSAATAWWLQHRAAVTTSPIGAPAPTVAIANKAPLVSMNAASAAAPAPIAATESTVVARSRAPAAAVRSSPAGGETIALHAPGAAKVPQMAAMTEPTVSAPAGMFGKSDRIEPPANTAAATPKAGSAKTYSPLQVSANLVAEAVTLDQKGHLQDAKASLGRALVANPLDLQARRMLVRLQIDTGRVEEAVALLVEGRRLHPEQLDFVLTLARLKAETGDSAGAIQLLEESRVAARDDPEYHALLAALLVRTQRHEEAVQHYLVALRDDPANGRWLVGVGVAFEGTGNKTDAAEAYRRAEGTSRLTPEMATFVSDRLGQLRTPQQTAPSGSSRNALALGQ